MHVHNQLGCRITWEGFHGIPVGRGFCYPDVLELACGCIMAILFNK